MHVSLFVYYNSMYSCYLLLLVIVVEIIWRLLSTATVFFHSLLSSAWFLPAPGLSMCSPTITWSITIAVASWNGSWNIWARIWRKRIYPHRYGGRKWWVVDNILYHVTQHSMFLGWVSSSTCCGETFPRRRSSGGLHTAALRQHSHLLVLHFLLLRRAGQQRHGCAFPKNAFDCPTE